MVTDVSITNVTTTEVVSLAKAKKQLRVESSFTDEDDLIQGYIDAAVTHAENYLGTHILDKVMTIKMTGFDNPLIFEASPIKTVTSIKYFEEGNDVEQTMATENYTLTSQNSKTFAIRFKNELPAVQDRFDAVTVVINIGMTTIDKPISQSVLLMLSDMYERREDRGEVVSTASMALLRPYKKF